MEPNQNLLFIAQDTLQEIRENKKDQRNTTYNFIIITGILIGLFETLKREFGLQFPYFNLLLKFAIVALGILTVYLLLRFQFTLSQYRKRMTIIWDDESFKFAFEKGILQYKDDCKARYYSFWSNFWDFTFLYILLVTIIVVLIFVLL